MASRKNHRKNGRILQGDSRKQPGESENSTPEANAPLEGATKRINHSQKDDNVEKSGIGNLKKFLLEKFRKI